MPGYVLCRESYGSYPWYAVPSGTEQHSANAAWLLGGPTSIETSLGTITSDWMRRFFRLKRDLLSAIAQTESAIAKAEGR